jgi:hypothetical protein
VPFLITAPRLCSGGSVWPLVIQDRMVRDHRVAQEKAPPRTGPDSSLQLRFGVRKDRFPSVCQDNSGCEESFPRLTVKRLPMDKAPFQPAPRRGMPEAIRTHMKRSRRDSNSEMSSQNIPLRGRSDSRAPAEFWPQRLFPFELRRRADAARI